MNLLQLTKLERDVLKAVGKHAGEKIKSLFETARHNEIRTVVLGNVKRENPRPEPRANWRGLPEGE